MEQLQAVVENRTGFCLDPRTKLLLMAVVATAEFLYSHTAFMIAVAMIPFVLFLTNRQYKTATVFFCLFAAGLFVQAIQNSVQFPMIVNMLVVLLVGLVLRLFPAFMMGAYIIKSTTASECITALGRMHIGRQITIPLSVLFRFIPTMQEESAAIKDAMRKLRGADRGEIRRMGEEDHPFAGVILREFDRALGGDSLEGRGLVANKRHSVFLIHGKRSFR